MPDLSAEDAARAEEITEELTEAAKESTGITELIKLINGYTDKYMLISVYSWDPELVIDGESVGVCHQPAGNPDNYASCWEWSKDSEGVFGS